MRKGRGRLSSIDMLPEEAQPHLQWANEQLAQRKLTQDEIRIRFNLELEKLDIPIISRSAFNRASINGALLARYMDQQSRVMAVMVDRLGKTAESDVGMLLTEVVKILIYDVLSGSITSGEAPSMKMLREASIAIRNLEAGRKTSVQTSSLKAEFRERAVEAVEEAGKKTGLDEAALDEIRERVYGIIGE